MLIWVAACLPVYRAALFLLSSWHKPGHTGQASQLSVMFVTAPEVEAAAVTPNEYGACLVGCASAGLGMC